MSESIASSKNDTSQWVTITPMTRSDEQEVDDLEVSTNPVDAYE